MSPEVREQIEVALEATSWGLIALAASIALLVAVRLVNVVVRWLLTPALVRKLSRISKDREFLEEARRRVAQIELESHLRLRRWTLTEKRISESSRRLAALGQTLAQRRCRMKTRDAPIDEALEARFGVLMRELTDLAASRADSR